ncbi:hypothetical protein TWF191_008086 [Orbilia oligospora]|uniref:Uncharacterized protein n=1 Tax=Orbilia oligospora TaxID=2813651 RepID=A0A7C8QNB2_ORBOL|nr:hypothetical protein TWF191_008086 [Orbilia oligospora]
MKLLIGLTLCALTYAAPSPIDIVPDRVARRAVCTPASGASSGNDSPAITSAFTTCGNGGTIVIPEGVTYYLKDSINFTGCANCDFQIEGTLKANGDTNIWNGKRAFLQVSKVTGIKIRSLTGKGVIDGNGQNSYDRFATDKTFSRPSMMEITNSKNVEVYGFWYKNPPSVFNSVKDTTNINFHNLKLSAISKSTNLPKNTDGFAVVRTSYTVVKNVEVTNTDDCVVPKGGVEYFHAENVVCNGSHGLSIGSLGKSGLEEVKHVLFKNFTGCEYGFQVQSCYNEDATYCASNPGIVSLSQIKVKNFAGKTNGKYVPTANINCSPAGTCDIQIVNWGVTTPSGANTVYCANTPSSLGVTCTAGASG